MSDCPDRVRHTLPRGCLRDVDLAAILSPLVLDGPLKFKWHLVSDVLKFRSCPLHAGSGLSRVPRVSVGGSMSRTVHGDASLLVGWSYGWIRGVTWFGLNVFLAIGCGIATMVESIGELVVWTSKIFDVSLLVGWSYG